MCFFLILYPVSCKCFVIFNAVLYSVPPIIGLVSYQSRYWALVSIGIGYLDIPVPINTHWCQLSSS